MSIGTKTDHVVVFPLVELGELLVVVVLPHSLSDPLYSLIFPDFLVKLVARAAFSDPVPLLLWLA
jgi:hypothetical protein